MRIPKSLSDWRSRWKADRIVETIVVAGLAFGAVHLFDVQLASARATASIAETQAKLMEEKADQSIRLAAESGFEAANATERTEKKPTPTGYVYLGICDHQWKVAFFDGLPNCDRPSASATISSRRGGKIRDGLPEHQGDRTVYGAEVSRLPAHSAATLLRIFPRAQVGYEGPRAVWGEVELPVASGDPGNHGGARHAPP